MKKYYIKPELEIVSADLQILLADSTTTKYIGGTTVAGGGNGKEHEEDGGQDSGGDGDFEPGLGSKDHNAWSSWDE